MRSARHFTVPLSAFQVKYVIKTSMGVPLAEGEKNACDAMAEGAKNPDAGMTMDLFQLPKSCPVEAVSARVLITATLSAYLPRHQGHQSKRKGWRMKSVVECPPHPHMTVDSLRFRRASGARTARWWTSRVSRTSWCPAP